MRPKFKYKQVIVVRTDLKMSKGKTAVQVAHGSVSAYIKASKYYPSWTEKWLKEGQKKVTVKIETQEELFQIAHSAKEKDLPVAIINDAGLTELPPGTTTVVGIGPGPEDLIDKISGHLKLL
ncbi:MAG: peptidyl-tRNA hydrolase Pth2 [Candidatus Heimdallarchaeum endolithica]|uniref:Peptidyl-tRNA hydrolase n=1 Tax=Candidatus Heimdallarchaeum endolithica TaxID=2876572 RepID=A0A9Y1BPN4_9ARCH|nr:MAG: peptidyl-tRNA hydrolase Pth2 [Candidatus Heimdallarchaeum endolithica]